MAEIAKAGAQPVAEVYRYFGSKNDFVLGLYQRIHDDLEAGAPDLPAGPLALRFQAFVQAKLRLLAPHHRLLRSQMAALLAAGRVRKVVCSFPRQVDSYVFDSLYREGKIELEVVPQGTLAERMRAAGAGIGAFFCPTGVGTPLAEGKETRTIDGRDYVLEMPIIGDVALIKAHVADAMGNLVYRKTARNFGPVMATAAALTIAEVSRVVPDL